MHKNILCQIFQCGHAEVFDLVEQPVVQGGANGIVIKVLEVQQPAPEQMKQDWDKAKEALLQQKREEYENVYVENLRKTLEKEGKIKINKKEMESLATLSEGS